ncbi:MAG TPA: LysM domain-containing protein [Burkholderiales bacterium]|nr:LysM domain-containing protein [Burkholderiales bacterium]
MALPIAWSQQAEPRPGGNVLQLKPDAPDSYVVKNGDTLWGISTKFLTEPWRWPEIWRLNKDDIRNPHLIFPGDIVRLDRAGQRLTIERLQPRVRAELLAREAIPTIPLSVIGPFLSAPLVIERGGLDNAPRIFATEEGRYNIGAGARAYVTGMGESKQPLWQVYRPGIALVDPDTKDVLGFEANYLGDARVIRSGDPTTVRVLSSKQEISEGDRLVVAPQPQIYSFAPRAPDKPIRGRIMSLYDGRSDARTNLLLDRPDWAGTQRALESIYEGFGETGGLSIVSLNKGAKDGIEVGHVLAIFRSTTVTRDRSVGPFYMGERRQEPIELPEERYGLLMVFRTFDNLSYALTLGVERPVAPGDVVKTP